MSVPYRNRTYNRALGELCGSVNPCQELICLAFYYQGLFLFSNQILVIWIPFLSRPDKTWKLADSLQLLTSGESSVVTDRYHLPATIPLQAGMINNIQLTRFLLLLYNVIVDLSMGGSTTIFFPKCFIFLIYYSSPLFPYIFFCWPNSKKFIFTQYCII